MENKNKTGCILAVLGIIILIIIFLIIFSSVGSDTTTTNDNEMIETTEEFTLVDSQGTYDGYGYYVTGTIVNNTNKQYTYVQVTFNLYDSSGAQVGTALDNINYLEANGTWKFSAIGISDDVASYKLAEITGW